MIHWGSIILAGAGIYIVLEVIKKVWPEILAYNWVKRALYVVPLLAGMLIFGLWGPSPLLWENLAHGVIAGFAGKGIYEAIHKVILSKVGPELKEPVFADEDDEEFKDMPDDEPWI